jgi:hypothetical protein
VCRHSGCGRLVATKQLSAHQRRSAPAAVEYECQAGAPVDAAQNAGEKEAHDQQYSCLPGYPNLVQKNRWYYLLCECLKVSTIAPSHECCVSNVIKLGQIARAYAIGRLFQDFHILTSTSVTNTTLRRFVMIAYGRKMKIILLRRLARHQGGLNGHVPTFGCEEFTHPRRQWFVRPSFWLIRATARIVRQIYFSITGSAK